MNDYDFWACRALNDYVNDGEHRTQRSKNDMDTYGSELTYGYTRIARAYYLHRVIVLQDTQPWNSGYRKLAIAERFNWSVPVIRPRLLGISSDVTYKPDFDAELFTQKAKETLAKVNAAYNDGAFSRIKERNLLIDKCEQIQIIIDTCPINFINGEKELVNHLHEIFTSDDASKVARRIQRECNK